MPEPTSHTHHFSQYLLAPTDTVDTQPVVDTNFSQPACYDSIFAPYKGLPHLTRKSLFIGSIQKSDNPQPITRMNNNSNGWIFALIFTLLVVLSIYLNSHRFKIKDIIVSLFNMRSMDRMYRESNLRPKTFMPAMTLYAASLSLLALYCIKSLGGTFNGLHEALNYLIIFVSLELFLCLKNLCIRLFGNLFEDKNATFLYLSSNSLFYFVGLLIITPLNLLLFYIPDGGEIVRNIMCISIFLLFVIRLFRGMQLILTNSKTSKLYLFYYLCIFEIVPILIAVKALFL